MTEQDEIRRLKELIAKQQLQLAEKDEIIRKQNIRIENMTQALLHAKKKIFGRSSEMTAPMKGQMFLFESTAELAKKLLQEQHAVTVPAHKRKIVPRKAGIREEMLSVLRRRGGPLAVCAVRAAVKSTVSVETCQEKSSRSSNRLDFSCFIQIRPWACAARTEGGRLSAEPGG